MAENPWIRISGFNFYLTKFPGKTTGIRKIKRGWTALVGDEGNTKPVTYPRGGMISFPTRKSLIEYLEYAYGGKKEKWLGSNTGR
jgi:hypothetical protein